jgi:hypothetical protein
MIKLEIKNCNNKDFKRDLKKFLKSYELYINGIISIDVSTIEYKDQTLLQKWEMYIKKSERTEEDDFISAWSPNNNSEIGQLRKKNKIIDEITKYWYNNYNKYESINMVSILNDLCYDFFDYSTIEIIKFIEKDDLEKIFENANEDYYDKNILNIETFKDQFLETLNVYFSRNPKFRMDW